MINRLKNIMSTALVVLMTAFQSYAQEPTVINVDMLGNTLSELSLYEVIDGKSVK